jgi:tRNA pseudouridine13 synthase
VRRLAAALGIDERDVGTAGLKDRRAVTRQQISLPPPVTPEAVLALAVDGVRVLSAARHGNKLKTGHHRGNRFRLVVRELAVAPDEAERRATAILARLARPPGAPAWYGEQRFGRDAGNVALGMRLLGGERVPGGPRERRLLVSAVQSELFNRALEERLKDGLYARVITGDVLRKVETGGLFVSADPAVDQPRLEAGEVVPTGPMFGVEMRAPPEGSEAAAREAAVLAAAGLTRESFARVARLAEGARRPYGLAIGEPSARAVGPNLELRFALPPGGYATVVAEAITGAAASAPEPALLS